MNERFTSSYPPAVAPKAEPPTRKHTPEMQSWLHRGWEASCAGCGHRYTSHVLPSDARCVRCNDIPTMRSALAAVNAIPQPATDYYNQREAKRAAIMGAEAKTKKPKAAS